MPHVFWLFGEESDCARTVALDVLFDETHFVVWEALPRSVAWDSGM